MYSFLLGSLRPILKGLNLKSQLSVLSFLSSLCAATIILFAPPTAAEPISSASLEVMSYNIRTGKANDGLDAWPVRKARTAQMIKKYHPDLLGVQEALQFQIDDLLNELPDYTVVGAGRADGRDGNEFSAIMYNTKRLQLLRSDTFWLSDTPSVPGSTTWGNKITRVCTWAHFRDRKSGKFFYHFNAHLDHISQPSRENSAKLMIRRINEITPKDPVIMTGDFNAGETNPVISTIKSAGYRDTYRIFHPNEEIVGTTNGFQPTRQENKIDYIFIDEGWQATSGDIRDDKFDNRWPSDHLGVTATVQLK